MSREDRVQAQAGAPGGHGLRCLCGSLLARRIPGGVELKCRRCRRTVIVPFEPEEGHAPR